MPLVMFGAIVGCGLLFYASYRYVRSHPPTRKEEEAPKEIAKGD
ncbi:hypothetical protein [Nitrobacter hamburgensis]|nr:hypothetical protein [Nitrobacter hamburgensis]